MRRLLPLILIAFTASAADSWLVVRSGPFEIITNAGDKPARETLNQLEQVRWVVGTALGKPELTSLWPIRVLILKSGQPATPALARDSYLGVLIAGSPVPRPWLRETVRILIESNARRMPVGLEKGMEAFYSTATTVGTRVTLGEPVPPGERDRDWAKVHLMVVDPAFSGKLRVLLYNLQQGADPEPAFRNAFAKTPPEMDKLAAAHLAQGNFTTIMIGGKPINQRTDFVARPAEPAPVQTAQADANPSRAAYEALLKTAPVPAHEGLGLLALKEGRTGDALKEFTAATGAGSTNARAWVELAKFDAQNAVAALEKAATLNAAWAEPHALLAERAGDASKKLNELKMAAQLDPRNAARWRALAEFNLAHNRYPEASKAWAAAEQASIDDTERNRVHEARLAIEQKRLDFQAEERKRIEAEKQKDLQKVKDAAMAEIRAAEERANRGAPPPPPDRKIVDFWEGPVPDSKVRGRLTQLDCLRRPTMRASVESTDGKTVKLLIRDPGKVMVVNGPEGKFVCGAQKPVRTVTVEYFKKADARLGTAGEAAIIEYSPAAPGN